MASVRPGIPHLVAGLACLGAVVLLFLPAPEGAGPVVMRAAAIVTLAVGFWATGILPEYFTSLVLFFLAIMLDVAPPNVVFSGFYSAAVWMVFGGLVFGAAVQTTGLGTRIAGGLVRHFQGSYFRVITGVVWVTGLLAFVLPSATSRVMIMMPIILALADRLGFVAGTRGRVGMALAVGSGTMLPTFAILPAAVPNLVLIGAAESIYDVQFTYAAWFVQHFPVIGLFSLIVLPFMISRLFPDAARGAEIGGVAKPIRAEERRLAAYLALALALWITDFAHGISPAWIALGVAILCLFPAIGVMPTATLVQRVNFGPWLFVAGVIGMGAVVTHSGLGAMLGRLLFPIIGLAPGDDLGNFVSVILLGMTLGIVSGMPGLPAIMTPLAEIIRESTGWPLMTVLMAQVPSWTMVLFPYQVPPMVLAIALSGIRMSQATRLLVVFTVFAWVVLVPLQYLWWRVLGSFG